MKRWLTFGYIDVFGKHITIDTVEYDTEDQARRAENDILIASSAMFGQWGNWWTNVHGDMYV